MKKIIVILIINFLILKNANSQNSIISKIRTVSCETLHPVNIGSFKEKKMIDYIINNILESKNDTIFISNRSDLKEIKYTEYNEDSISFKTNNVQLTLIKRNINIYQLGNIEIDTSVINDVTYIGISRINKRGFYGISEPKDTVSQLYEIKYNNFNNTNKIPDSLVNDLFFPNFHNILYPIKPLKVYSDDNGYDYIYLFGQNKLRLSNEFDIRSYESYMAKFIFYKGRFLKRIIVPHRVLSAYEWYCDRFIGF